jgi:glycine cleavage system transcriptional repressor
MVLVRVWPDKKISGGSRAWITAGLAIPGPKTQNPPTSTSRNTVQMKQQLVLNVVGNHQSGLVERLTKAIRDSGTGIIDSRMTTMGSEFVIMMLLTGTWDSIAKLEGSLPKMEKELDARIISKRTEKRPANNKRIPYTIEIVSSDRSGVVHDVAKFLSDNHIDICELYTSTYRSPHTDLTMFSLHMIVNIPADSSITTVRGEFMDFCDQMNLDAVMEPAK